MTVGGTRPYLITDQDGNVIHQEESLGVETESALFLQPGRETKQMVKYLFIRMEDEILDLRANPIKTTILNKQVEIHVDVEPSQFDNSTLFHICGVDGAFCKVV